MREILEQLDRWQEEGESIALATLVRVQRSAPRLPGARLALTRSGRMAGSVSGGCVEGDVLRQGLAVLDAGRPVVARYGIADEEGLAVGLSCGGTIDVLVEPFAPDAVWRALREAVEKGRPAAWAVGLAPETLLARKLALLDDGQVLGSVHPDVDAGLVAEARRLLPEGGARTLGLSFQGGEAACFVEALSPPLRLYILGATHIGVALARMARLTGFGVTVIDARSPFATAERFPDADEVLRAWPDEVLDAAALGSWSYVVSLSHDFKFEIPALLRALRSGARYVGALGSRATHEKRVARLREEGLGPAELARIRAPIGLDLGGRSPEEIAVAILAEMLAVRHARDGGPLCRPKGSGDGAR